MISTELTTDISVVQSLIPKIQVEALEKAPRTRSTMQAMCAYAKLIANLMQKTFDALEDQHYKLFDANPGDGGCQKQALEIRRLSLLKLDYKFLEEIAQKIFEEVPKYLVMQKGGKCKEDPQDLFKVLKGIRVSKEVDYLLHCRLLYELKAPGRVTEEGITRTTCDFSRLKKLSKRIEHIESIEDNFLEDLMTASQVYVSRLSMEAVQTEAERIQILDADQKSILIEMLASKNTLRVLREPGNQKRKTRVKKILTIGCLFFEMKTLLYRLREEQALVCLKSIAEKQSFRCFLKPNIPGDEFSLLSNPPTKQQPIVVFGGAVMSNENGVIQEINQLGLTMMLALRGAKESKLKYLPDGEGKQEIKQYQTKAKELPLNFKLFHVYCNSLFDELGGQK